MRYSKNAAVYFKILIQQFSPMVVKSHEGSNGVRTSKPPDHDELDKTQRHPDLAVNGLTRTGNVTNETVDKTT
jgi:hypothetical protein